jgi:Tol biopolymer transport system component
MKAALAAAGGLAALTITGAVLAEGGPTGKGLSDKAQVFVVDRGGEGLRQLTSDGHDHSGLAWSPRGHRLATSFSSGIQVLSPETGRVRTFRAPNVNDDGAIAWSPDGGLIAYETTYDNRRTGAIDARLKTLAVRTGTRRVLADPATSQPSWAPGGRSLVYVRGDVVGVSPSDCTPPPDRPPDPSCHPEKAPTEDVRSVGRDGRHRRRLVRNASSEFAPQLSRDGRRLLFARTPSSDDGSASVWVANRDGSHQTRLAHNLVTPDVAWAPNDRDVAVLSAGRSRAWAFVLSRSRRRRKLPRAIDTDPMAWSPDGRLIAWPHYSDGGIAIEVIRPDGTGRRVNARLAKGVQIWEIAWSPDGRRLAFTASKPPPED